LQGSRFNSGVVQLARGAGGRGETLNLIALPFRDAADDCEGGCLARAGEALDSLNAVRRTENIFDHALLRVIEMRVLIGNGNGLRARKDRLDLDLSLAHPSENLIFRFDCFRGSELAARNTLGPLDDLKFSRGQAGIEIGADLGMGDLAHPTTKPVADQRTFIHNRLTLKVLVARKGHPSLERYGIAPATAEHNRIAQQDDATFQEAVEITTTGTILDGYAQWKKALDAHCSQILCIEYSLTDEQAIEWLLRRHRRRNGWNKYCRTVVVLELENKFRQEVANQRAGGQKKGPLSDLTKGEETHVRSKLAKLAHVCEAYIDYVKQLRKEAHPSILQALERGEISIHWAWTLLTFSKSEQSEILENRRTAKAVRVAYPRPRKPKTISIDPSRMLQVWQVLAAGDARNIQCTVVSIDGKKVEIRMQINEELFTGMQSQGELNL
jgi:hypothetical protein